MTILEKSLSATNKHVVMLLNNPCVNDSRVIKSAEALVKGGIRVTVLCRHDQDLLQIEEINGVIYRRLSALPRDLSSTKRWLIAHLPIRVAAAFTKHFTNTASENLLQQRPGPILKGSQIEHNSYAAPSASKLITILQPLRAFTARARRKIFRVFRSPARKLFWFLEMDEFKVAAYRCAIKLQPDAVHCHDLATLPTGVAVSKHCGCKLVYDSHELEMHRNATYSNVTKKKRRRLESIGITRADAVITVSDSIADHLMHDYKISRPNVVMNSPSFDKGEVKSRTVRDDLGLTKDTPLAVYVGSVTVNRGLEYVVRSLVLYPEIHFATVGPRRELTVVELHELAIKLGVRHRLHFVDPVEPSEVVGYISTADVSVLAIQNVCLSYYYCMPNKLLESVFSGIPVAVSNLIEMRRFVENFNCGLVMDERSPSSIAETLKRIVSDRESFVLSPENHKQVEIKYSWATQACKIREIYDRIFRT